MGNIMNETPKVVFSKSLSNASWKNSRVASGDLRAEIEKIKREFSKDAYVLGSGNLCAKIASENLFDEYRIGLISDFLGKGTPLFTSQRHLLLKLLESKPLGEKAVLLRYVPNASN
jgi:dihydrofolate reductase